MAPTPFASVVTSLPAGSAAGWIPATAVGVVAAGIAARRLANVPAAMGIGIAAYWLVSSLSG